MGLKNIAYKSVVAVLSWGLLVGTATAAPEPLKPLSFKGRYTIAWSGIPLGRILIEAQEDASTYSMSIDTKTKGIGALVSDATQVVSVNGDKADEATYIPRRYVSRPHKKEDADIITLTYDAKGNITERVRTKDDDPTWRPPVPFEKVNTARDPVTAAFILRRALYDARASDTAQVSQQTYDGMRLATMKLIRTANARVEIAKHYVESVNVLIKREPIDGYTPKELKKYKKGDPEIHLYFSDDAAFLPIRATAKAPLGELSMTLVEQY